MKRAAVGIGYRACDSDAAIAEKFKARMGYDVDPAEWVRSAGCIIVPFKLGEGHDDRGSDQKPVAEIE